MRSLIVFAHPDPNSFNAQIVKTLENELKKQGYPYRVADLYRLGFDPLLRLEEIRSHTSLDPVVLDLSRQVIEAQLLIFVYPDWWGGPPAVLKGFLDRVFRPGVAYDFLGDEESGHEQVPLFSSKGILVLSTTDHENEGHSGQVWQNQIIPFCGAKLFEYHALTQIRHRDFGERREWLNGLPRLLQNFLKIS